LIKAAVMAGKIDDLADEIEPGTNPASNVLEGSSEVSIPPSVSNDRSSKKAADKRAVRSSTTARDIGTDGKQTQKREFWSKDA
jgi:hypothetical protein